MKDAKSALTKKHVVAALKAHPRYKVKSFGVAAAKSKYLLLVTGMT
jgi:hypothetical protein